jgi:rubrerythrin
MQTAPMQGTLGQMTPMQTAPMQGTLGQMAPMQTAPMQGTLGQMTPMQTAPMQGTLGQMAPMQTTPGQMTLPGQMMPGQMPGSAAPGRRPPARDTQLINDINEAIIREAHAYNYYARLAELAADMRNRQTLLRIQQDEAKHYGWFTTLMQRAGLPLPMIPPGALPRTFDEGVRAALRDETQAVPFYQSIAARAQNRNTQVQFRNAARDEQEHATLLLSMLTIL